MSQKNETIVLVLSLLVTAALLGAGFWWFTSQSKTNSGDLLGSQQIEIANDDNIPDLAKQLATKFVKDAGVLAVIGHNSDDFSSDKSRSKWIANCALY